MFRSIGFVRSLALRSTAMPSIATALPVSSMSAAVRAPIAIAPVAAVRPMITPMLAADCKRPVLHVGAPVRTFTTTGAEAHSLPRFLLRR
jgi:hypothetical protein